MYLCLCSPITETELKELIENNPYLTLDDLKDQGITNSCESCLDSIQQFLNERKTCPN